MFGKGMGNMAGMMKKVQKMQEDMKKMQEELKTRTVEASVGGGAVTVARRTAAPLAWHRLQVG